MVCVWASSLVKDSELCYAFGFVFHHMLCLGKNCNDFRASTLSSPSVSIFALFWAPRKKSSGHTSCAPLQVASASYKCVPLSILLRTTDNGRWV